MPSCLLLALVLLGTTSARHLGLANLHKAEPSKSLQCPMANETRVFRITDPETGRTYSYAAVPHCQTFNNAQHLCAQCYDGRLASIHNFHTNTELQFWAGLEITNSKTDFWIGAEIDAKGQTLDYHWTDNSPWNYAHWQSGYPQRSGHSCATFSINDGYWRSAACNQPMPYVCEF